MHISQALNDRREVGEELRNDIIPELKIIASSEGKFSSLTLLLVTIVLFFSSQIVSVQWQDILILIGVLLFHEMGHLAAMKLLKYNDVKMFFIPFLGAAVSGKSRNDTAVKSCIVSLMGPFPGVVLGVLLYIMFLLTKNYFVFKTAQVMLLLNAFNFLPIMPLDGGRYIDVLFINRRYFRFLFAFIGAALFILLAASAKDIVIGIVGIVTIYIALSNFKLHGISRDLKAKGIKASTMNELIGDENALQTAIDALREKYPRLFKPKTIYRAIYNQLTVIVDTIKFVPARLLPKIALLSAYLVLVTASVLVSTFFLAADYREIPRIEVVDGKKYVCVERHLFGRKRSECPVNEALYYDGKGVAFESDGTVSGNFYYNNGYRSGEWMNFDREGRLVERRTYEKGRLLSLSEMEGGMWKTYTLEQLTFLRRWSEEIQQWSQPYRSNYTYF